MSVVNLGRLFNALMSSVETNIKYADGKTPKETRQRFSAFFASIGYLHEGIKLFERMEKQFAGEPIFDTTIGKIMSDPEIKDFNNKLADYRSNISFHFDEKPVKKALNEMKLEEYIFASSKGNSTGDIFFEISENTNINYITRGIADRQEEEDYLREFLSKSSSLTKKTAATIQKFIGAYMADLMNNFPEANIKYIRAKEQDDTDN